MVRGLGVDFLFPVLGEVNLVQTGHVNSGSERICSVEVCFALLSSLPSKDSWTGKSRRVGIQVGGVVVLTTRVLESQR